MFYSSTTTKHENIPGSDLFFPFSSVGGRAGRTYTSSTSFLFTLERLGSGSLLWEDKKKIFRLQ